MASISDYNSAADYLGRKTDRPLTGRASRIIRRSDDTIAIRYQATDVITYRADGTAVLQTDGWQSVTTKARFSEYSRARVWSVKGRWFIGDFDKPSLYFDGIVIDTATGLPVEPRYPTETDVARKRKLDKAIAAYVKGFAAHVAAGELADPSGGDCWGCCMQVEGAAQPTQGEMRRQNAPTPHGRVEPMGLDHYLSHFEEGYYVPALLANAIKASGYTDPGFIWHVVKERKDGEMAARVLRRYFSNMKPALMALQGGR